MATDKSQKAREAKEDCEVKIAQLEEDARKAREALDKSQAEHEAAKGYSKRTKKKPTKPKQPRSRPTIV